MNRQIAEYEKNVTEEMSAADLRRQVDIIFQGLQELEDDAADTATEGSAGG